MSFIGDAFSTVGDFTGDITGTNRTSDALSNAAREQFAYAQKYREQTLAYAAPTAKELEGQQNFYQVTIAQNRAMQDQLAQYAQLAGQINPIISDAFLQASRVAQGQNSAYVSPYLQQMQIQQQRLQNQLQAQMGGGYASSSAGAQQQALFANQQSQGLMGVQQNALQSLLALAGGGSSVLSQQGNQTNQTSSLAGSLNNSYLSQLGSVQTRQMQASMGTNISNLAGAQYAGDIYRGQAQQQFTGQTFNFLTGGSAGGQAGKSPGSLGGQAGGSAANYYGMKSTAQDEVA